MSSSALHLNYFANGVRKTVRQAQRAWKVRRVIRTSRNDLRGLSLTVVAATDMNSEYLDCLPHFIEAWEGANRKSVMTVRPHVLIIGRSLPAKMQTYEKYCTVLRDPISPSTLAAQMGRIALAARSRADLVVTTDIDMIPLSLHVLEYSAMSLLGAQSDFVVVRDIFEPGQYPMCYAMGPPSSWQRLTVDEGNTLTQTIESLLTTRREQYSGIKGGSGWYFDQEFLYDAISREEGLGLRLLKQQDSETGHLRLDRELHPFPINWLLLPLTRLGFFSDYHMHMPIRSHRRFLSLLIGTPR